MSFFGNFFEKDHQDDDSFENEEKQTLSRESEVSQTKEKGNANVKLVKPLSRDEMGEIAGLVMSGIAVVVNLENILKDRERFVDFMYGVCYALNGTLKKIAADTFIALPGGMSVEGSIFDDFDNL